MTHNDLIERVARAICADTCGGCNPEGREKITCQDGWKECISSAKAALAEVYAALREPTPEMMYAGNIPMGCRRDCYLGVHKAASAYRAMLQASPLNPEN